MKLLFALAILAFLPSVFAHSWLSRFGQFGIADDVGRGYHTRGRAKDYGIPESDPAHEQNPCMRNGKGSIVGAYPADHEFFKFSAGTQVEIEWPGNGHRSGTVDFLWAERKEGLKQSDFKKFAALPYSTTGKITLPAQLPKDVVIQWNWDFGRQNYRSCVDIVTTETGSPSPPAPPGPNPERVVISSVSIRNSEITFAFSGLPGATVYYAFIYDYSSNSFNQGETLICNTQQCSVKSKYTAMAGRNYAVTMTALLANNQYAGWSDYKTFP